MSENENKTGSVPTGPDISGPDTDVPEQGTDNPPAVDGSADVNTDPDTKAKEEVTDEAEGIEENEPYVVDEVARLEEDFFMQVADDIVVKLSIEEDGQLRGKLLDPTSGEVLEEIFWWPAKAPNPADKDHMVAEMNHFLKLACRKFTDWCADA